MPEINALLRSARLQRHWPIKTAASHAEVSATTYLRWEQGIQDPHLVNLQILCDVFNVAPEKLGYGHLVQKGEIEPGTAAEQRELERTVQQLDATLKEQLRLNRTLQHTIEENLADRKTLRRQNQELTQQVADFMRGMGSLQEELIKAGLRVKKAEEQLAAIRREFMWLKLERQALYHVLQQTELDSEQIKDLIENQTKIEEQKQKMALSRDREAAN